MNHRGDERKTTPLEFFLFVMLTVQLNKLQNLKSQ